MRRYLAALCLSAALAAPAAAQSGPMTEMFTSKNGSVLLADKASLLVQGSLRTLWVAARPPGKPQEEGAWMRVDCATPRYQFVERVEMVDGARTPVGESEWHLLTPNVDGMKVRDAICAL